MMYRGAYWVQLFRIDFSVCGEGEVLVNTVMNLRVRKILECVAHRATP
jgi:hypothetical protein